MRLLAAVFALLLAALLTGCGSDPTTVADPASTSATTAPSSAAPTPADAKESPAATRKTLDFSATTVEGRQFDGASLAGKPAVLWFWAPWCPTCRGQIDGVSALADEYGDAVSFVGVGSLDQPSAIAGFADEVPADFPHLQDPEGAVWRHFGVIEQSTYVVLDAHGTVVSEGYLSDADLGDLVAGLAA